MSTLLWIAALSGWLCVSFALLIYAEARSVLSFGLAALTLIVTTGLLHPRWGIAAGVISATLYGGLWWWLEHETGNPAAVLAGMTAFGGAVWLSRSTHTRIRELYRVLRT